MLVFFMYIVLNTSILSLKYYSHTQTTEIALSNRNMTLYLHDMYINPAYTVTNTLLAYSDHQLRYITVYRY